jgi:hypothetical protein
MKIYDIGNEYRRQDILGSALYLLHTDFRNQHVYENAYTLRVNTRGDTPVEYVDDTYWKASNMANHPQFNTRHFLLWWQGFVLRDTDAFPVINIHPIYEQNGVWGRGQVGVVLTKFDPTRSTGKDYIITGEFNVSVNLWHLGGGGINDHADMWAYVIAHEMLHNLGHLHQDGEYVEGRQIIAFSRAIFCRGYYDGNINVPPFA